MGRGADLFANPTGRRAARKFDGAPCSTMSPFSGCNDLQRERFVILNHPSVSRHHATICTGLREDGSVWISVQDVGSLNGVRFFRSKTKRLEPYVTHELEDQDVIFFGEARVLVMFGQAPPGSVVSSDGRKSRDVAQGQLFPPPRSRGEGQPDGQREPRS
mmetsp:Transcript_2073/g.4957  ORF Transcript_2073/g.4957 Transcript_2073/m.4957 type:complete len:160 (-) Transcript_2073:15-494(-)